MHLPIQRPHTSPFEPLSSTASAVTRQADAAASPGDSNTSSASTSTATITANDFLQLLVTELKNQDPTANTDPNEYVDQLVQVNSLQQLIQINQNTDSTSSSGSSQPAHIAGAAAGSALPPALEPRHAAGKTAPAVAHGKFESKRGSPA